MVGFRSVGPQSPQFWGPLQALMLHCNDTCSILIFLCLNTSFAFCFVCILYIVQLEILYIVQLETKLFWLLE